jgi:hypothetical protein
MSMRGRSLSTQEEDATASHSAAVLRIGHECHSRISSTPVLPAPPRQASLADVLRAGLWVGVALRDDTQSASRGDPDQAFAPSLSF